MNEVEQIMAKVRALEGEKRVLQAQVKAAKTALVFEETDRTGRNSDEKLWMLKGGKANLFPGYHGKKYFVNHYQDEVVQAIRAAFPEDF